MSNKPHQHPHQKAQRARRMTRLLTAILIIAIMGLGVAISATGHILTGFRP